jgi:hypothetical protein
VRSTAARAVSDRSDGRVGCRDRRRRHRCRQCSRPSPSLQAAFYMRMPVMDGLQVLPLLRRTCPDSVIGMYSSAPQDARDALRLGADEVGDNATGAETLLDQVVEPCRTRARTNRNDQAARRTPPVGSGHWGRYPAAGPHGPRVAPGSGRRPVRSVPAVGGHRRADEAPTDVFIPPPTPPHPRVLGSSTTPQPPHGGGRPAAREAAARGKTDAARQEQVGAAM